MSSHAATATIDHHHDHTTSTGIPNKKLLMWAFLASDCMFFGSLIATHLIYRLHPPPGNPVAKQVFSIELTSFSTFILLMSSLMMALAVTAIQKGNLKSMRWSLLTTIFFGCIFLGCQVYEFNEFVHIKKMTISNSILGSTFFTLTGTHGTHVAIGVFWLLLMYVRSFQPVDGRSSVGYFVRTFIHVGVFIAVIGLAMYATLGLVHALQNNIGIGTWATGHFLALAGFVGGLVVLLRLAQPRGPVEFNETNAIDVESMGLYWHFVDIVWIVIFTAVYLLEYI
jgi:cytochrome o ubiquinol oxidase subunit III